MTSVAYRARLLVVDDEPHVLEAVRVVLENSGYHVRTALNGTLALESIAVERPDLVILDLAMADLDGVEVVRRVRSWSQLPILVLSARTDELEKVRALDAGADDYVTKPFGARELLARVRTALRRERERRVEAPSLRIGDLVVDLALSRAVAGRSTSRRLNLRCSTFTPRIRTAFSPSIS